MTLRSTISTPEGKRFYVRRLFATIADRYDFITRFLSYGQDRRWKQRLIDLAAVSADDRVLDLACGTGDLLFAAAADARAAVGLDLTYRMLQLARSRHPRATLDRHAASYGNLVPVAPESHSEPRRAKRAEEILPDQPRALPKYQGQSPWLVTGDMLALPFGDSCFDVVTTGYGLRNVPDLASAIQEIHRVLAPGGRFLSLDFDKPANPLLRIAYLAYLTVVGSVVGFALHRDPNTYRYIPESIRQDPGARGVAWIIEAAGFTDVRVVALLGGLMAIHVARKPTAPATAGARRAETSARPPRKAPRAWCPA